mmetsp:Transcript_49284/g.157828  ORF Transcript_49284/g.157828 Transcript_49284/m.157828 type:complete len:363 (-) Transcript_49284:119-1207(-)
MERGHGGGHGCGGSLDDDGGQVLAGRQAQAECRHELRGLADFDLPHEHRDLLPPAGSARRGRSRGRGALLIFIIRPAAAAAAREHFQHAEPFVPPPFGRLVLRRPSSRRLPLPLPGPRPERGEDAGGLLGVVLHKVPEREGKERPHFPGELLAEDGQHPAPLRARLEHIRKQGDGEPPEDRAEPLGVGARRKQEVPLLAPLPCGHRHGAVVLARGLPPGRLPGPAGRPPGEAHHADAVPEVCARGHHPRDLLGLLLLRFPRGAPEAHGGPGGHEAPLGWVHPTAVCPGQRPPHKDGSEVPLGVADLGVAAEADAFAQEANDRERSRVVPVRRGTMQPPHVLGEAGHPLHPHVEEEGAESWGE